MKIIFHFLATASESLSETSSSKKQALGETHCMPSLRFLFIRQYVAQMLTKRKLNLKNAYETDIESTLFMWKSKLQKRNFLKMLIYCIQHENLSLGGSGKNSWVLRIKFTLQYQMQFEDSPPDFRMR